MNIYYLGLIGNVFSRGLFGLCNKYGGKVFSYTGRRVAEKELLKLGKAPIIFGHSLGARAAIKTARRLYKADKPVKALVLLDYVGGNRWWYPPIKVPNGIKTIHLHTNDGRVRPVYYENGKKVKSQKFKGSHINLDDDPAVWARIEAFLNS